MNELNELNKKVPLLYSQPLVISPLQTKMCKSYFLILSSFNRNHPLPTKIYATVPSPHTPVSYKNYPLFINNVSSQIYHVDSPTIRFTITSFTDHLHLLTIECPQKNVFFIHHLFIIWFILTTFSNVTYHILHT